jgi:hypothetical protein
MNMYGMKEGSEKIFGKGGFKMSKALAYDSIDQRPGARIYEDRQWGNVFTAKNPEFKTNGAIDLDMRAVMFACTPPRSALCSTTGRSIPIRRKPR